MCITTIRTMKSKNHWMYNRVNNPISYFVSSSIFKSDRFHYFPTYRAFHGIYIHTSNVKSSVFHNQLILVKNSFMLQKNPFLFSQTGMDQSFHLLKTKRKYAGSRTRNPPYSGVEGCILLLIAKIGTFLLTAYIYDFIYSSFERFNFYYKLTISVIR